MLHQRVNLAAQAWENSNALPAGDSNETLEIVNNIYGGVAYEHFGTDWRDTAAWFHGKEILRENSGRPTCRTVCADERERRGTSDHQLWRSGGVVEGAGPQREAGGHCARL